MMKFSTVFDVKERQQAGAVGVTDDYAGLCARLERELAKVPDGSDEVVPEIQGLVLELSAKFGSKKV